MKSVANSPRLRASASSHPLVNYYALHAPIYDATRWTFLFDRSVVLELARAAQPRPTRILEIGCGTGRNLAQLARLFPHAHLTGVDLSTSMLNVARRKTEAYGARISLLAQSYDAPLGSTGNYDLVLCSYALSMFNPGFEAALAAAQADLTPHGHFAFVDFHASRWPWFSRWMRRNHVRMDGQLRPLLRAKFTPVIDELHHAYGGVWDYCLFIGRKKN
jgi:S-adenosylmethionine-diacylgycerolhomoserine-N-methlytransferase